MSLKNLLPRDTFVLKALVAACILASGSSSFALEEISEEELSSKTGEGLAYFAENFSLSMGDTDYLKMTSTGEGVAPTGKKAEFYLYGLNIGGTDPSKPYSRSVTPVSVGSVSNPVLYKVYKSDFVPVFDPNEGTGANEGKAQIDVFEIAYPRRELNADGSPKAGSEENLKWSAWIDLLGRDSVGYTENIELDPVTNNPVVNRDRTRVLIMADKMSWNGSYLQQWKTTNHPTNDAYSGKVGLSGYLRANTADDGYLRISADLRTNPSPITGSSIVSDPSKARFGDAYTTTAPEFGADKATDNQEGFYWKNFSNNMPLGILGYQPQFISTGGKNGRELVMEVARIPNNFAAYNAAYIDYSDIKRDTNNDPILDANGNTILSDAQQAKMCTAESCPSTASHATLSYQVHTRLKDGSFIDVDNNYYGLGLGANIDNPGSAGLGLNGSLDRLQTLGVDEQVNSIDYNNKFVADQGGTYSKFEGMFVQHLKITTKAFE